MKAYLYSPTNIFPDEKSDFGLMRETFEKIKVSPVRVNNLPTEDRAFVIIAGAENFGYEDSLSAELRKIDYVILFITSDESGQMDVDKIDHPNIKIWVQSAYPKHHKYFRMPIGAPGHMRGNVPEYSEKKYDAFFAGQVTHERRVDLARNIVNINNSVHNFTQGFMQGFPLEEYYFLLAQSKFVPAPAGNVTIDSFRLYEAIEMLCIPIGDTKDSQGRKFNFWEFTFGDVPFPKTSKWTTLKKIIDDSSDDYEQKMHNVVSWWIKWKRDFAIKIKEQYHEH